MIVGAVLEDPAGGRWVDPAVAGTIGALVADAARRFPDAPALRDSTGRVVRHGELDARAREIASFLTGLELDRERPIGLLVDHRIESIEAMLGILGAGHSYVPLDPRWPVARLAGVARRLGLECLFTDATTQHRTSDLAWSLPTLRHLVRLDVQTADWPVEVAAGFDASAITVLWNEVAADPDRLAAAGFGTFAAAGEPTQSGQALSEQAAAYFHHVEALLGPLLDGTSRVLEVGCGTGEVGRLIAPRVARYTGVDPSPTALARLAQHCPAAQVCTGFAHDLPALDGPFDVAVLSSVVQFFPDVDYLMRALGEVAATLVAGASIVLADLVDPQYEEHAGLRLSPGFFHDVVAALPGVTACTVRTRDDTALPGRGRYDVLLTVAAGRIALPAPVHRWTSWHTTRAGGSASPIGVEADLAYTIFTSGSTGTPKGVAVAHREAGRLLRWVNGTFDVGPGDTLLFVCAFGFDLSVYDVFGTLAAGACLRILSDRELAEPESVVEVLAGESITIWDSAPAAMQRVLLLLPEPRVVARELRLVLLSGDWIPVPMPDEIRARFPAAQVIALGGATECTVWSNFFRVGEVDPAWPSIPYGRAMPHARYEVLDERLQPCSPGVAGDLYISGGCLAIGYLGDAGRTAERFLADPMSDVPGQRMYATGDRASWLEDGNLRFLGRLDDQVKVRGYRIELGEVQARLAACPQVRSAAVLALGTTLERRIVACYVPGRDDQHARMVASWLADTLPAYMVPDDLVAMTALPVSVNGKLDRAALSREYAELGDSVVRGQVARAWTRVTGRQPYTVDADFFDTGAGSLAAAQLVQLLAESTGCSLDLGEIFAAPSVRGLTLAVARARAAAPAGAQR